MQPTTLQNPFLRLSVNEHGIDGIDVAPKGDSIYQASGILSMRPGGNLFKPARKVTQPNESTILLQGMEIQVEQDHFRGTDHRIHPKIPIYAWADTALPVPENGSLGQSFIARTPFYKVGVYIYAAGKPEEIHYRVTLREKDCQGPILAQSQVKGSEAFDYPTIWSFLTTADGVPGAYYLEVDEARGGVAWWTSISDIYQDGCAYVNGRKDEDRDLMFLYAQKMEYLYHCDLRVNLIKNVLMLKMEDIQWMNREEGECPPTGLMISVPWTSDGYDVSASPFVRFQTDRSHYVPIEQFKRFPVAWPKYQSPESRPAFTDVNWIEAIGREVCNLRFSHYASIAAWPLEQATMHLCFHGESLQIEFLEHNNKATESFPRFSSSDKEFDTIHNSFFYERSYGMNDMLPGGEWLQWIAPQSVWVGGHRLQRLREGLLSQIQDPDGYIWAMGYDGGYPHGLRYGMSPRARRHYGATCAFISGCHAYYCWTRDEAFLRDILPRMRRAVDFMQYSGDLLWKDDLVVIIEPHHNGTSNGMASTELDCLPFGYKCALTNAHAYKALKEMAGLEEILGNRDRANHLNHLCTRLRLSYNRHFWDDAKGRYIGCIDVMGKRHDYGFTLVNLVALYCGLADKEQVLRVYDWMENHPTATGECDTYKFIIAPRANTLDNQDWWYLGGDKEWPGKLPFGLGFQNGGAFMFSSYYDILVRLRYLGVENAFQRYREILDRYQLPDKLCGGNPLYHGEIDGFQVGASVVFPEAGLVPNSFLYGFLGIHADERGISISPSLPAKLSSAAVHQLHFAGAVFDIHIERRNSEYEIELYCSENPHDRRFYINNPHGRLSVGQSARRRIKEAPLRIEID